MTYAELALACLKKYRGDGNTYDLPFVQLENDVELAPILRNVGHMINRAFSRIEARDKVPYVFSYIGVGSGTSDGNYYKYDLSSYSINDIINVGYKDGNGEIYILDPFSYRIEGNCLWTKKFDNGEIRLVYSPKIARFSSSTLDNEITAIPNDMVEIIPYFVYSELMKVEEPSLALTEFNLFESYLDDIVVNKHNTQKEVVSVWRYY